MRLLQKIRLNPDLIAGLDRETAEAVTRLLEAEKNRRRQFPLAFYLPHRKQGRFHKSEKRVRVELGSNRCGKTTSGGAEAMACSLGYRPWLVPDFKLRLANGTWHIPSRDEVPAEAWVRMPDGSPIDVPNRGIIVSGQGLKNGIGETIIKKIREMWPNQFVELKEWKGPQAVPVKLEYPNGSAVILASGEQKQMTFEGTDYHWCWLDEPVPRYVYGAIWRGLTDHRGLLWLTQTPLTADAKWVYMDLVKADRPDVEVIEIGMRDNEDNLPEGAIEEFENYGGYTEQERAARLYGRFEFLSDQVYSLFDGRVHIIENTTIPPGWRRGVVVDPHMRKPWAIAYFAIDPADGALVFYTEHPEGDFHRMRSSDRAVKDYAVLFRELEGKDRVTFRFLDPNAGRSPVVQSVGKKGNRTIQEELAEYGLEFSCRISDSLDHGHAAVQDALRWDKNRPMGPGNRPKLFFMEKCRNLILAMENYAFMPIKDETKNYEGKVSEEFKDFADLVRYAVVASKATPDGTLEYLTEDELVAWGYDDY